MDANQKSDWIGKGKLWASAPPVVKKIASAVFSILQAMELALLPSAYFLIAEFRLPLENTSVSAVQPAQHFNNDAPNITNKDLLLRLPLLPVPDTKTVHKLAASRGQAWSDGAQSIIYSHLGGSVNCFPVWVRTYWEEVVRIKRVAWGPWRISQQWINKYKKISPKNPISYSVPSTCKRELFHFI
ncbi:hypothetical protein K438DRAFT_1787406 [Mycena galopus ATCC 62051]|nr:hypothetical protein K438DRAFT_1787406 [Mycena galopus ATCC 62051]